MVLCVYLLVGFMAIALFGPDLQPNILIDIEQLGALSLLMRLIFLIVIICHIPFIFFCAKEGACIVSDEIIHGSMTASLSNLDNRHQVEVLIINNMDDKVYYGITVLAYIACIIPAISLHNLLVVFDYLSALTVSGIQFLMPGIAYVVLSRHQTA